MYSFVLRFFGAFFRAVVRVAERLGAFVVRALVERDLEAVRALDRLADVRRLFAREALFADALRFRVVPLDCCHFTAPYGMVGAP